MTTDDNFSDVLSDEMIQAAYEAQLGAKVRELTQMIEGFQMEGKRLRAELEAARRDADYRLWKLQQVIPVMQEARDALSALTTTQLKLHNISPSLATRMDYAGTADVEQWQEAIAKERSP